MTMRNWTHEEIAPRTRLLIRLNVVINGLKEARRLVDNCTATDFSPAHVKALEEAALRLTSGLKRDRGRAA
jgi:hypothetical protein